ncbi:sirohydrochlorin chelatase [Alicyclobacillus dauci]|uniref:Sirohydrochlorin chelatase n=1 Tax=Alicyclobacillus dauci TaxID=1475485 RepID=A0ABY6Z5L8_9BACL|nr:sirohydrochlorin chelatase [Alicyclobacillus dauci]WAH37818.1 sirohydrochlorin chelatase [Alicyclobacillus dauci]
MTTGVLFIGHGTRRQHGVDEFLTFVQQVLSQVDSTPGLVFGYAFLELQSPDIIEGIRTMANQGVTRIVCIPLFLFAAGHIKEDIPVELARANEQFPDVTLHLGDPFGTEREMMDALFTRVMDCFSDPSAGVGILLLGRGNKDKSAQDAFMQVARDLHSHFPGSTVDVGFLAGTGTAMESGLDSLVDRGVRSLVIMPYLWFSGWLTDTLPRRVGLWREEHPDADVRIARHLGIHPQIVKLVARRVAKALDVLT